VVAIGVHPAADHDFLAFVFRSESAAHVGSLEHCKVP
jgi:hypothetical protein